MAAGQFDESEMVPAMFGTTPGSRNHADSYGLVCAKVGPHHQEIFLPKRRLCTYPYFETAFYGYIKEARHNIIYFEEESPAMFALFVRWLLSKSMIPYVDVSARNSEATWQTLFDVWMFAEMTMIRALQDAVTDTMIHFESQTCSGPKRTVDTWSDLRPKSNLRRFLVDLHVQRAHLSTCLAAETRKGNHDEEMLTLVDEKRWETKGSYDFWQNRCDYHSCCQEGERCDEVYTGW